MANAQTRWVKPNTLRPDLMECVKAGYNDRMASNPYPKEYETWTRVKQRNYENGRLRASNILLVGIKAPVWRSNVRVSEAVYAAYKLSKALVGDAIPGRETA